MLTHQPVYVGENHPEGQAVYNRFMAANPNLRFRWDPTKEPLTLGGMVIANPRSRWGYNWSVEKWGDIGNYSIGLDHVQWFYDQSEKRWVLASLPNIAFNDEVARRCIADLHVELARINGEHRLTPPGQYRPEEELVAHIGDKGTSWRIPDHPLLIVASNLVTINLAWDSDEA